MIKQYKNGDNDKNVKYYIDNEEFIPISVIDISYDVIRKDAFDENLLNVSNQKIKETLNGKKSPYMIKNLYAASTLKSKIYQGKSVNFLLDNDFYFSNKNEKNIQYCIDFDDGLGFRNIDFGKTLNVSYFSTGIKTIKLVKTKKNKLKGTTKDEQSIAIFSTSVEALTIPSFTFEIPLNIAIPSTYPYGGVDVKGTAYVYTSDGSQNIRNPIIVCEGFDPLNERGWNELYNILNGQNLIECLKSNGYDFIILNFTEGATYIERNAYLLKGLIENINARKITQNELIVVGASMGGLISRYALAYMEKNGVNHDARLFVSFDSPHKGANIPLGVQEWLKFFGKMNGTAKDKYNKLICSIAARQMLVYHSEYSPDPTNNPYRIEFLQNLNSIGYPTKLRKIAIANGSGNAYGQQKNDGTIFNPADQIIRWEYYDWWTLGLKGNSWAVPNIAPKTTIFYGKIDLTWVGHIGSGNWNFTDQSSTVSIENSYPYDNAPGGTTNATQEIASTNPEYGNITTNVNNHCFIPTISSLDLYTSNLFYNIDSDLYKLYRTSFDAIYYPKDKNEEHVYISEACVKWLMDELVPKNIVLDNTNWNKGNVRASESITLKDGFSTIPGTKFYAYISPLQICNTTSSSVSKNNINIIDNKQDNALTNVENIDKFVHVYPNPNNGKFYVRIDLSELEQQIQVRNIQGQIVYKQNINFLDEIFIDISNQPIGIYFVEILQARKVQRFKIIKNVTL